MRYQKKVYLIGTTYNLNKIKGPLMDQTFFKDILGVIVQFRNAYKKKTH